MDNADIDQATTKDESDFEGEEAPVIGTTKAGTCPRFRRHGDSKQGFATVDTRVRAFATPLSLSFYLHLHPHRNQILTVGGRQGACQMAPPGLRRKSISGRYRISHR